MLNPIFSDMSKLEEFVKTAWGYTPEDYNKKWSFFEVVDDNFEMPSVSYLPFKFGKKDQIRGYN